MVLTYIGLCAATTSMLVGYIGPGAGLSAIGAFLALVFAVIVAMFGFVWYPIRRLIKGRKRSPEAEGQGE